MKIILRTSLRGITIDSDPLEVFDFTDDIISLPWKRNELPLEEEMADTIHETGMMPNYRQLKEAVMRYKKTDETVKMKDGFARVYELFTID